MAHLRADGRHHCLALVEGASGVIASGFTVADEDALAAGRDRARAARFQRHPRRRRAEAGRGGCGSSSGFDDPFGNRIELVASRRRSAGRSRSPAGAGITEFGHLCLDAPDVHEAYRFWCTTLQRPGVGLDRRRRLPDADRPGAPQARRVPGRRAGPVPHELPGRRPSTTSSATGTSWSTTASRSRWARDATRSRPRSSSTSSARRASPTSTPSASGGSRTTPPGCPRTFDPDELGSIDMWLGPTARPVSQPQLRSATPAETARHAS